MRILGIVAMLIVVGLLFCLLMAFPFMWIWNFAVVQAVTFANPIEYWVAFWLMMFVFLFLAGSSTKAKKNSHE